MAFQERPGYSPHDVNHLGNENLGQHGQISGSLLARRPACPYLTEDSVGRVMAEVATYHEDILHRSESLYDQESSSSHEDAEP